MKNIVFYIALLLIASNVWGENVKFMPTGKIKNTVDGMEEFGLINGISYEVYHNDRSSIFEASAVFEGEPNAFSENIIGRNSWQAACYNGGYKCDISNNKVGIVITKSKNGIEKIRLLSQEGYIPKMRIDTLQPVAFREIFGNQAKQIFNTLKRGKILRTRVMFSNNPSETEIKLYGFEEALLYTNWYLNGKRHKVNTLQQKQIINHYHGTRIHKHLLPSNGLHHSHGNGPKGEN